MNCKIKYAGKINTDYQCIIYTDKQQPLQSCTAKPY
jgi:hypothetical protein